mgnify:FL=1|jgi:D-glycero-D-manno-heptose 1,7-bisphosphate phosphatase
MQNQMRLVVLDRDGTLNLDDKAIIAGPDDWTPIAGAFEAVARLNQAGWRVVIATNQSGLGRGLFDADTMNRVHAKMNKLMATVGARVDAVFFCPHTRDDACDCRKPKPGLILKIAERFGVPVSDIAVAGNTVRHIQAGHAAGARGHLLLTGKCAAYSADNPPPGLPHAAKVHASLDAFVDHVLASANA